MFSSFKKREKYVYRAEQKTDFEDYVSIFSPHSVPFYVHV